MQREQQVIPVVGSRKLKQIEDTLAAADFELNPEHIKQLDDISKIKLGFPHDFLASNNIRKIVYAGTWDKIDRDRK